MNSRQHLGNTLLQKKRRRNHLIIHKKRTNRKKKQAKDFFRCSLKNMLSVLLCTARRKKTKKSFRRQVGVSCCLVVFVRKREARQELENFREKVRNKFFFKGERNNKKGEAVLIRSRDFSYNNCVLLDTI